MQVVTLLQLARLGIAPACLGHLPTHERALCHGHERERVRRRCCRSSRPNRSGLRRRGGMPVRLLGRALTRAPPLSNLHAFPDPHWYARSLARAPARGYRVPVRPGAASSGSAMQGSSRARRVRIPVRSRPPVRGRERLPADVPEARRGGRVPARRSRAGRGGRSPRSTRACALPPRAVHRASLAIRGNATAAIALRSGRRRSAPRPGAALRRRRLPRRRARSESETRREVGSAHRSARARRSQVRSRDAPTPPLARTRRSTWPSAQRKRTSRRPTFGRRRARSAKPRAPIRLRACGRAPRRCADVGRAGSARGFPRRWRRESSGVRMRDRVRARLRIERAAGPAECRRRRRPRSRPTRRSRPTPRW